MILLNLLLRFHIIIDHFLNKYIIHLKDIKCLLSLEFLECFTQIIILIAINIPIIPIAMTIPIILEYLQPLTSLHSYFF